MLHVVSVVSDAIWIKIFVSITRCSLMQLFLNDLQVAYLLLADTLDTAFTAAILYEYLIAHYGEPLGQVPWSPYRTIFL